MDTLRTGKAHAALKAWLDKQPEDVHFSTSEVAAGCRLSPTAVRGEVRDGRMDGYFVVRGASFRLASRKAVAKFIKTHA